MENLSSLKSMTLYIGYYLKIKKLLQVINICLIVIISLYLYSCDKEPVEILANVHTSEISYITKTSAICGGVVLSDEGREILHRGVCWGIDSLPTILDNITSDSSGKGEFVSILKGLNPETKYYVRAYAITLIGTGFGNQRTFSTMSTLKDIDGNSYDDVQIGSQTWMVQNLKTTRFNDGSSISNVTNNTEWSLLTSPGYCWLRNEAANKDKYGALYNLYAVNDKRLCPVGWHVPTSSELDSLISYLGGAKMAGGALRSLTGWEAPNYNNIGVTNSTGFSALPGGTRNVDGTFQRAYSALGGDIVIVFGRWWSSGVVYEMVSDHPGISVSERNGKTGASVRCLKNK